MNVIDANRALSTGAIDAPGLFPHLESLRSAPFVFRCEFGLDQLPAEPGLLLVRGARQYGKSTWLEQQLRATVEAHGAGSAYYLNGDAIASADQLIESIRQLLPLYRRDAPVRRLFLDELTAIADWERGLKRLLDAGELRNVLVVTTGSRATDLRRGSERLPGRKGRLARTHYWFTPVSYAEFVRVCGARLGADSLPAYMLAGGCPVALAELAAHGRLPEFVPAMVQDWLLGECALAGRDRRSLLSVLGALLRHGGVPIGQLALAREAGLANNTVAAGYVEMLGDLMCVGTQLAYDASRRIAVRRRPAKFPFLNLLVATTFHPSRMRTVADFQALAPERQGDFHEWMVAQEVWRRAAIAGNAFPDVLQYWQSKEHELDFVVRDDLFVEVKRGRTSPVEHAWFARTFPRGQLWLVGRDRFEADRMRGATLAELLLDPSW